MVSQRNLRRWYQHGLGKWLHANRLFSLNMNGYDEMAGAAMVEANWQALSAVRGEL